MNKDAKKIAALVLAAVGLNVAVVHACGSSPFVAEICIFPYNFAPNGYALAQGQILPISQNTALFSLLGTTYGGDGKSTFALPDLSSRVAISAGQGPGLSLYDLGEWGGAETVTLTSAEMPVHTHSVSLNIENVSIQAKASEGSPALNTDSPANANWAQRDHARIYSKRSPTISMRTVSVAADATSSVTLQANGFDQAHDNMMPYLVLQYAIALQGIFPPRG